MSLSVLPAVFSEPLHASTDRKVSEDFVNFCFQICTFNREGRSLNSPSIYPSIYLSIYLSVATSSLDSFTGSEEETMLL